MASRSDIAAGDRDYAPDDDGLLSRLSPAEAALRAAKVRELHSTADGIGDPEIRQATHAHARRMQNALPYGEFVAEEKRRRDLMADLPGTGDAVEIRGGHYAALDELRQQNPYPSGISRLDNEAAAVKAAPAKGPLSKSALARAIDREMQAQGVQRRIENLRKDLDDYKREHGI